MEILTELCQELRNWFDRNQPKYYGEFAIENGVLILSGDMSLRDGQYFRVIGSALNDGVHKYGVYGDSLTDEEFTGTVWAMAIPPAVLSLADDIQAWQDKYGAIDGFALSPFTSESFGGYSYSKSQGGTSAGRGTVTTWQAAFANRLNKWRKI